MRPILAFVLALLLAGVQAGLLHFIGGGAVSVTLALPVVVYLGLKAGNVDGAVGAAAVGYVLDLVTGGPKGLMTFLAVALFLGSRGAGSALSVQGKSGFVLLSTVGTFLVGVGALGLTQLVSTPEVAPGAVLVRRVAVEALVTGLLSPLILLTMRGLDAIFVREEPSIWLQR